MFDAILGLPMHPLVVHGAVVLIPLAAILAIVAVARPTWKQGPVVAASTSAVGAVFGFLAKESGEALASRVGIGEVHEEAGELAAQISIALVIATVALVWVRRLPRRSRFGWMTRVVSVGVLAVSLGAMWGTYQAGHSGAKTTWGYVIENTKPGDAEN